MNRFRSGWKREDRQELLARIAVQLRNAVARGASLVLEHEEITVDTHFLKRFIEQTAEPVFA